jgi:hypothetical protein
MPLPALKVLCERFSGGGRRCSFELLRGSDGLERGIEDDEARTGPGAEFVSEDLKVVGGLFRLLRRG